MMSTAASLSTRSSTLGIGIGGPARQQRQAYQQRQDQDDDADHRRRLSPAAPAGAFICPANCFAALPGSDVSAARPPAANAATARKQGAQLLGAAGCRSGSRRRRSAARFR